MKKIVFLLTTIICAISFCIHPFATDTSSKVISIDNIDVIFRDNSTLTAEEKQIVADRIINNSTNAQTYGLICNLFGHKNTTEYVTTITHCAYSTAPRCLEEQWEVTICTRCENTETRRIAFYSINCCPEE